MEAERIRLESEVNYNSYNLILLFKYLAFYYLNTGLISNVYSAKHILSSASKMFEMGNYASPEQYDTYYQINLMLALVHEFFSEHDQAFQKYESKLHEINQNHRFVSEETKNLFHRMMYIISSDNALEEIIASYSGSSLATSYQNKRRILEKKIINGRANDADIIEISELFKQAKPLLDKLYHVTHFRLLYIYYANRNEVVIANAIFQQAIDMAFEYEFSGQIERLTAIRQKFTE